MTDETDSPTELDMPSAEPVEGQRRPIPADSAMPAWLSGLPDWAQPYVALSRLDRPVGIWLLALPCWIGLVFASIPTGFSLMLVVWAVLFAIGSVAMRGAGCTWNDITDRDLDAGVARTAGRPLPSGQLSLSQAYAWLGLQLFIGLLVWLTLPLAAKLIALLSIPMVVAYPYMKRIIWWPQGWLGLTFNWGVLVAVATVGSFDLTLGLATFVLWMGLTCWTVAYDTIYALQDVEDDALLGIKSTARLFGDRAVLGAFCFHLAAGAIIALAGMALGADRAGALAAIAFVGHGAWQTWQLRDKAHSQALAVFKSNVWAGAIILAGFFLASLL